MQVRAEAGPGLIQRLGRVLKEKAAGDFDRFFKGATKTRVRLGVSLHLRVCATRPPARLQPTSTRSVSAAATHRNAGWLVLLHRRVIPRSVVLGR